MDSFPQRGTVLVLAGLPRDVYERDNLEREQRTGSVQSLHGFWFYREPVPVSTTNLELIRRGAEDPDLVNTEELVRCEFHPDFAVRWWSNDQLHDVLVCYGCSQIEHYVAGTKRISGTFGRGGGGLHNGLRPHHKGD